MSVCSGLIGVEVLEFHCYSIACCGASCSIEEGNQVPGCSLETIRTHLEELKAAGVQEVIPGFPDVLQLDKLRFFAQEFID